MEKFRFLPNIPRHLLGVLGENLDADWELKVLVCNAVNLAAKQKCWSWYDVKESLLVEIADEAPRSALEYCAGICYCYTSMGQVSFHTCPWEETLSDRIWKERFEVGGCPWEGISYQPIAFEMLRSYLSVLYLEYLEEA